MGCGLNLVEVFRQVSRHQQVCVATVGLNGLQPVQQFCLVGQHVVTRNDHTLAQATNFNA